MSGHVGTGTTVARDVPAGDLAIGRAKQDNKTGYADRLRARFASEADAQTKPAGQGKLAMDAIVVTGSDKPLEGRVRVSGAKRDVLQEAIALVKKQITDFPLQYGNFRD